MNFLAGTAALAAATWRDLRRRPALLLSVLALCAFLWLLPDICARAVDDAAALGLQAGISTIALYLMILAGFAGLRAGGREGDLGAAPEWRTTPLRVGAYVAGRFVGIMTTAVAALALLVPLLVAGQLDALSDQPPAPLVVLLSLIGTVLGAAQLAAIGIALAAITSQQLAAILLLGVLVAGRTAVPELAAQSGWPGGLAALLPDPARLDLSRDLAFHRTVDAGATCWAFASTGLSAAACLCTAVWALGRRET